METAFLIHSILRLSLEDVQENSLIVVFLPQLLFMKKENEWTLPF